MTRKVYTDEQIAEAKKLFMQYLPVAEIARRTKMVRGSMYHYIRVWEEERMLLKAELISNLSDSKKWSITTMTNNAIEIITKSLQHLAKKGEISLHEAKQAASILETLDKIARLDDNRPTDILSNPDEPITIEVIEQKLKNDPFYKKPKEIEHDENN